MYGYSVMLVRRLVQFAQVQFVYLLLFTNLRFASSFSLRGFNVAPQQPESSTDLQVGIELRKQSHLHACRQLMDNVLDDELYSDFSSTCALTVHTLPRVVLVDAAEPEKNWSARVSSLVSP